MNKKYLNSNKSYRRRPGRLSYLPLVGIGVLCVLLIVLFVASRIRVGNNPDNKVGNASEAARFISKLGWEVTHEPSSVKNVEIPTEFDPVYEDYNNLQKSQGYDLTEYRSKIAVMYTFKVLNYVHASDTVNPSDVFANVLVYEGRVIAGDLVCYALDGFLRPIRNWELIYNMFTPNPQLTVNIQYVYAQSAIDS